MQALERRISTLEQASSLNLDKVIFIVFNTPGSPDTEIHKLRSGFGNDDYQQWTRELKESEQDFKGRAKREVKRNQFGVAMLFKAD